VLRLSSTIINRQSLTGIWSGRRGFAVVDVKTFTPSEFIPSGLLWDVWDIVAKQGEWTYEGIGLKLNPIVAEIHDFTDSPGGSRGMIIAKINPTPYHVKGGVDLGPLGPGTVVESANEDTQDAVKINTFSPMILELKNGLHVLWDKNVTVADMINFVARIDNFLRQHGEIVDDVRQFSVFEPMAMPAVYHWARRLGVPGFS